MEETRYGLRVEIPVDYERAVEQATAALKEQGFGVLTTIDVQQTLKQKLDRDFRKYVILGACNPPLADRALHAELEVGLLLPCNVVVYEVSPYPPADLTASVIVRPPQGIRYGGPSRYGVALIAIYRSSRLMPSRSEPILLFPSGGPFGH